MSQQRRCPYCGRSFDIGYFSLCSVPLGYWTRRWRGRCEHCQCDLQASLGWELMTGLASVALVVALFVLTSAHMHKPSSDGILMMAVGYLVMLYLVTGGIRYLTIRYPRLS